MCSIFFNLYYSFFILVERLGIHIEVDQLLFDSADRRRFLPSLLQLCVHELVATATPKDCSAVFQLRRHPHESARVARYTKAANQSDPAQGLQGSREWQVCFGGLYFK